MTVFGDGAFKEVTAVRQSHESGALISYDWCPDRRRETSGVLGHTADPRGCGEQVPPLGKERGSGEAQPANVWIVDFESPKL